MTTHAGSEQRRFEDADNVRWLRHNRVELALHRRSEPLADVSCGSGGTAGADGPVLLVLHGLGECAEGLSLGDLDWPGAIYALDFTGHGRSTRPVGGGYTSEVLIGDVDAALEELGGATIFGRGLGAYIGLLIAAARPADVRGVILGDGPGIAGGGVQPGTPSLAFPAPGSDAESAPSVAAADPFAMVELSRDVRPPDYAQNLARIASENSELETVLFVAAVARPEWLEALVSQPAVRTGTLDEALACFAGQL